MSAFSVIARLAVIAIVVTIVMFDIVVINTHSTTW